MVNKERLVNRIKNEYEAFHFQKNGSNWCYFTGWQKAGKFFDEEAKEELVHADKIQSFLNDWGCRFSLPTISTNEEFSSLGDLIRKWYEIEVVLYNIYSKDAKSAEDISEYNLYLSFVEIQRESVAKAKTLVDKLNLIDESDKTAMLFFEEENF